jgi:hypothetical protein
MATGPREILRQELSNYLNGTAFNNETNERMVYFYTKFEYNFERDVRFC